MLSHNVSQEFIMRTGQYRPRCKLHWWIILLNFSFHLHPGSSCISHSVFLKDYKKQLAQLYSMLHDGSYIAYMLTRFLHLQADFFWKNESCFNKSWQNKQFILIIYIWYMWLVCLAIPAKVLHTTNIANIWKGPRLPGKKIHLITLIAIQIISYWLDLYVSVSGFFK